MTGWDLRNQVRARVAKEEGVLGRQASLRIALCYPSPYSVGMSSLGFQTIYREIHLHPDASAERAFLPDRTEDYRSSRTPVFTYESEAPLSEFPVVAFSISFELEIPGLLEMLDLSGIPVLREDRTPKHPLVLIGGPLTNSNPIPLAPFADLIILGEAEELIHAFLDAAAGSSRSDLLSRFASLPGCYVPGQTPSLPAIAKAADDRLPARSQIIAKDTVLSSMFLIEPERGCSRGCTYCVMRRTTNGGMRLVSPDAIQSFIPASARRVGLVGAAVTDHPRIKDVVREVVKSGRQVGISSLRADRLDDEFVGLLAQGGYRTLTTASDGASQRLRNVVDRKTTERHLIRAAELTRKFKLKRLKLYQMVGLPGETTEDIDDLIRFSTELAGIAPLSLGVSPFVAKRNTPLDGSQFESIPVIESRLARLRAGLKGIAELRPSSARWAWVEYMLSQGGEAAGLAAMDAWRNGGTFAAWKRAFTNRGAETFQARPVPDGRRRPHELTIID
ncbi:MAG TPA: radical SAM protein [Acidobacteriota bacterium]|nr:radical SAM protein [Acidobacteriota bacterium]